MIDLLYHATIYNEICKFLQEADPTVLTYDMVIEKAKAHERNVLEYKDHQASHGGANSAPSYNNPLLSAHALSKRRPSGRGNNGQRCCKCGKSHERGNCPAYGKTCNRCQGINHFKVVCRSKVAAKTGQSPHQSKKSQPPRRGSTGSYNGRAKGGKKKKTPKKPPKQNAHAVTMKNSVQSEVTTTSGGEREKKGNVSSETVLSGPEEEGTYNRFSCFAVHSKMAQSTNAKSKPSEGLYTDTDPDDRSEIITDVTIRMPGKAGTMMMEVKVDPGAQPSCIPLHKFKTLFPHLCRDGLPKEGLLDNTHNEFQSYNGGDMTCYGHLLIDVKDKVTKKYHPIRFYMMNTEVPRILISHAASYWLGLVRVLCDNKAPRIKRQVASIDKKSDLNAKSGHFRTSSSNTASSSKKKQTTLKTVTSGKGGIPSPRMHSFEDAKSQAKKKATGVRPARDVDVRDGEQHSQDEASATNGKEPKTSKQGYSVHSGPNKKITDSVKDGPFSNTTDSNSNVKNGPKMKHTSKKAPHRKYYRPSDDTKTFQINSKGHLQCVQDPKLIHRPNDKGKLPGSREASIYHEPGTVSCKTVEDLKKLYPNSFDRLGSLKSSHFRTSTSNTASSSKKKQTTPKTVTSGKGGIPSPRMHSFEDAKSQAKKKATGVRPARDVDVRDGEQHSQDEASATNGKEPKTSKQGYSVHSGPNKKITDSVKDGPFSNTTDSNSNVKNGPKMKHTSKKAPHRKYYRPSDDTKTFQINSKGHLQCVQDPKLIHRPNDKGKLPGSREASIYHEPGTVSCKTVEDLKKLYPNSFDRLGSLKGAYNIRIDPLVKPAMHARRKVPIESKEAIDRELDYLIEEEIITEQVEPTPWVSSVTFPRKPNGDVQVCLDPSNLNKAIIREHHKPMTVEEIAHELAGATVYTKADALKAFLQIHLTHEASLLTTFNSHRGRLRFLRMPFGAKMSQDMFQLRMDAILEQCPGVIGIHDDMVIFGVDQEDHDANLINLLNVCQKEGLVLNSKKLELRRERVIFFGAEYSTQGIHPDPKKVQGITEMTAPKDKQQLRSFLGMVNYMGTFIPNLSHHTEPLRAMLKKDNVFHWEDQQTRSFQQVKTLIAIKANTTPLRYYDRNLPVTVQADASLRGLGACLIQKHKGKDQPIAFASKSLTDAETRYANIEWELLAIVFACQRLSTYLLGRSFIAESDHKHWR